MKLMLVLLCSVITLKAEPVISLEISNLVFIMVLTHLITSWHILKSISATIFTFISHNSKSVIDFSHFLARSVCYCMMSGNAMLIFQWFIVSSYTDSSWGPLAVESVETTESRVWLGWQHRCGPVPLVWRVWLYPWNSPPSRGCCTLAATLAAPGPGDYSLLMPGPLATGLHTGRGLHLELQQQRPHHAGAGYKQRAGEPRQCPLYPVSSSTSRCSGGRCGVLRSIHYTLIGMQAAGAGPAPAGHTAPTIPSSQPQTSSLSTCCVHCHWSAAQELRAVRRGDLFSYLLLLKPFFNIHDTWWTLGSKWYRQSDDLLQEVIKITFGPACHINYQYETGAEYVVCRAAWCWGWILDHKNCATDTALTHTASHSSACSL